MNRKFEDVSPGLEGVESVRHLCRFYRNLMIDADFDGDEKLMSLYLAEYERLSELLGCGVEYEPNF